MEEPYLLLKVQRIVHETPNAVTIQLHPVDGKSTEYRPGQFITLVFKLRGKETRRSFSLSSAPGIDPDLAITVKRIANGEISTFIYNHLKVNDIIDCLPPAGRFVLDNKQEPRDIFMVAAGSGITPAFSIIKSNLVSGGQDRLTLIYSNRNEKSTIFYKTLNQFADSFPERFRCVYIFSEPEEPNHPYKGHLGMELLQTLIEENLHYPKTRAEFMLCGPFGYMRKAEMLIVAMGFAKEQVHKENYVVIAEQEAINTPPEQSEGDKAVAIVYKGQHIALSVPKGKAILKTSLQQGIYLPYSCQGGICGTCSAICKGGEVKMTINDVLTPKELAQGWILTCVGYPITPNVELVYP